MEKGRRLGPGRGGARLHSGLDPKTGRMRRRSQKAEEDRMSRVLV